MTSNSGNVVICKAGIRLPHYRVYHPQTRTSNTQMTVEGMILQNTVPDSTRQKPKAKFTLEQATKAQRWRRGIALLFLQPRR
jgi:hypothetical protein